MTKKIYETDSYVSEFKGTVINCTEEKDGFFVELDQTAFFPNQGGQSCDRGTINGVEVTNVEIRQDRILHYMNSPLEVGAEVVGKIDFGHRFRNMQMHSGEHIFSGLVCRLFGYNNVGFHLSDNSATMDFNGKLTLDDALKVEEKVNAVIFENRSIRAFVPSKEELKNIDYRSKKEIEGDIRLVEVEGVDICACCAPHVSLTGEIGIFKVVNLQNYKSGVRIDYLCGYRALEYFNRCTDTLNEISRLLSVKPGAETEGVKSLAADNKRLGVKLFEEQKKTVDSLSANALQAGNLMLLFIEADLSGLLKYSVESMHAKYGSEVAVFAGNDCDGYRYIIESEGMDLTPLCGFFRDKLGGKGGGRKDCIQGNVAAQKTDIISALSEVQKQY